MDEPLDEVLRRVASGELSPDDAEVLIAALAEASPRGAGPSASAGQQPGAARGSEGVAPGPSRPGASPDATGGQVGRAVRVLVTERGRTVVNLRIPMSWTGLASLVPGLSGAQLNRVTEALRNGERGRILDFQDANGDGVVITTE
jgi:hypothetical protein